MPSNDATGSAISEVGIDQSNLSQALLDFEIANARVVDLTRRLTDLSRNLVDTREELERFRVRCFQAEDRLGAVSAELGVIKSSSAYRTFRNLGQARAKWLR